MLKRSGKAVFSGFRAVDIASWAMKTMLLIESCFCPSQSFEPKKRQATMGAEADIDDVGSSAGPGPTRKAASSSETQLLSLVANMVLFPSI